MPIGQSLTIVIPRQRGGNTTHLGIIDRGSQTVTVTSRASLLGKSVNGCTLAAAKGIRITPGTFTLKPGQRVNTTVYIPPGTPTGDYAAIYYATPTGGKGNVHVTGSVGALLRWHGTHTVSCVSHVAPKPSHGFSGTDVLYLSVLLFAAVAALIIWRLRRTT